MPDPIELPLDDDRLAEPPLVDSLHYDQDADGFSMIFVPSTGDEEKQAVFVQRDSPEGRMIAAYLYRIQDLIEHRVQRVVHRGGGDYTFQIAGGGTLALSDEGDSQTWAPEVFDRLKQIAEVGEVAFGILHATHR
jgi:hypothetical protein